MAEIIDTGSAGFGRDTEGWVSLVKWSPNVDRQEIEPSAKYLADSFQQEKYRVEFHMVGGMDREKKAWFTIRPLSGRIDDFEGPSKEWDEALKSIEAESEEFHFHPEVTEFVRHQPYVRG